MEITIKFFASLREQIGKSEVKLASPNPIQVSDIWLQICPDKPLPAHILIARNMQYVEATTLAYAGDEIAFFPPVTGG
jgi:molybdopterin synthase sulfur carrier subunit